MADVSKISINGTSYDLKDTTARSSAAAASTAANDAKESADGATLTANTASSKANANAENITKIIAASLSVSYDTDSESVVLANGISV